MVEAALFDGDQTLWDFQRVMRAALIAVPDRYRVRMTTPALAPRPTVWDRAVRAPST